MNDDKFKERMVALANRTPIADVRQLQELIGDHQIVLGVFQDQRESLGVGLHIIKGALSLGEIVARGKSEQLDIAAVRCRHREEAEAMRQTYGDLAPDASTLKH